MRDDNFPISSLHFYDIVVKYKRVYLYEDKLLFIFFHFLSSSKESGVKNAAQGRSLKVTHAAYGGNSV